jgi:CheY-like chemotaxis protein/HPt (histidine-containing phosphotransfer) domain-containing protein
MAEDDQRRKAFESRLDELKQRMESGLLARAHTLREAVSRLLAGDESARKVLKQESHRLRGIAGSYGHDHLTVLAGELEKRASLSPPPQLQELAIRLADAAEAVGKRSATTQSGRAPLTPVTSLPSVQPQVEAPPAAVKTRKRAGSQRVKAQGAHGGALRVLAMDDDPTTLRLLHLTLSDIGGFDSVLVTSAKQALELMRVREFDVVISDAMMPDMNGKEFCAAARQLGGFAERVPIIILSAATQDELHWRTGLSGPVVWLRKPFMPSALVKDIARVAQAHRTRV